MHTHERLKKHLERHGMLDVQPVNVTVKGVVFVGASYTDPGSHRTMIYVIGDHPLMYRKGEKTYAKRGVCFRMSGDERDWYIASYFHPGLVKTYFKVEVETDPKFHPFGNHFLLAVWDIPNSKSKIDTGERKPYERRKIIVEAA